MARPAVRDILLLRHASERQRPSNSARLVDLAIDNARIIDYRSYPPGEGPPADEPPVVAVLPPLPPGAVLLFPDGRPSTVPPIDPAVIVVVDGTWSQARRMRQRQSALRGVPVWNVAVAAVERERFRRPPTAGAVSTLEAIAAALAHLGDRESAASLIELFDRAVAATDDSLGHRHR